MHTYSQCEGSFSLFWQSPMLYRQMILFGFVIPTFNMPLESSLLGACSILLVPVPITTGQCLMSNTIIKTLMLAGMMGWWIAIVC
jgi:hypothetical protein